MKQAFCQSLVLVWTFWSHIASNGSKKLLFNFGRINLPGQHIEARHLCVSRMQLASHMHPLLSAAGPAWCWVCSLRHLFGDVTYNEIDSFILTFWDVMCNEIDSCKCTIQWVFKRKFLFIYLKLRARERERWGIVLSVVYSPNDWDWVRQKPGATALWESPVGPARTQELTPSSFASRDAEESWIGRTE